MQIHANKYIRTQAYTCQLLLYYEYREHSTQIECFKLCAYRRMVFHKVCVCIVRLCLHIWVTIYSQLREINVSVRTLASIIKKLSSYAYMYKRSECFRLIFAGRCGFCLQAHRCKCQCKWNKLKILIFIYNLLRK